MAVDDGGRVTACRSCGGSDLVVVLDLGATPVANALLAADGAEPPATFPLGVQLCEQCGLVQLVHDVAADAIFAADYPYYASVSSSTVARAGAHAADLVGRRGLGARSLVVELGSNDGYLLRQVRALGVPVLGVDPATGPARAAADAGVATVPAFFGTAVAEEILREHGPADAIVANNVLAHVPDLGDVVGGIARLLGPDGVVTVECASAKALVERLAFDTIYHEHYSYFTTHAAVALFARHGLHLNDVAVLDDVHGGSLRWWLSRTPGRTAAAERVLADEAAAGVGQVAFYADFAARVHRAQAALRELLVDLAAGGARIAAYGAAAKGVTLLGAAGVDASLIDFVVDKSPSKWHKRMPGSGIPIEPPAELLARRPDYAVLLAWNLADEIVREQRAYVAAGGRFVVPVDREGGRPKLLPG